MLWPVTSASGPLRVGVVGAGIGGLVLAQGLRGSGVDVTLLERDAAPEHRGQGYRVTVQRPGATWLAKVLDPTSLGRFRAAAVRWDEMRVTDEQLRPLVSLPHGRRPQMLSIDRAVLRRILLDGVEDRIRFGTPYERYAEDGEGVTVHLADGSAERFDLLVGADGSASAVRRQRLPERAELHDTGIRDIATRLPMTPEVRGLLQDAGLPAFTMVLAPDGRVMIVIPQRFGDAGRPEDDYLYFGLLVPSAAVAGACTGPRGEADPALLREVAAEATAGWHPVLRELVALARAEDVALLDLRTSVPHGPWPTSRVTLLGDAVHSMTPMAGAGANAAIRDGGELAARLAAVARGERALLPAVADFERVMLTHGFAAVRRSDASLRMATGGSAARRDAAFGVLRTGYRAWARAGRLRPAARGGDPAVRPLPWPPV